MSHLIVSDNTEGYNSWPITTGYLKCCGLCFLGKALMWTIFLKPRGPRPAPSLSYFTSKFSCFCPTVFGVTPNGVQFSLTHNRLLLSMVDLWGFYLVGILCHLLSWYEWYNMWHAGWEWAGRLKLSHCFCLYYYLSSTTFSTIFSQLAAVEWWVDHLPVEVFKMLMMLADSNSGRG